MTPLTCLDAEWLVQARYAAWGPGQVATLPGPRKIKVGVL